MTQAKGHNHGHGNGHRNERQVGLAALVIGSFMLVEVVGGLLSGSLALLADAGHMLTDFAALSLAWFAFRIARRPADRARTYGFDRVPVLAAFVNGVLLVALCLWIVIEALQRLADPQPILGGPMLAIALLGLLVNIGAFWLLHRAESGNLNIRGAMSHVIGDLLGSVAAIIAACVILWTGWIPIDPLLSLLVAGLILRSAVLLLRDAGHILLEGAPKTLRHDVIADDLLAAVPEVREVHHVHAWSLSQERPLVTLHARIEATAEPEEVIRAIKKRLAARFEIEHSTVEIERHLCADRQAAPAI
ncbi:cation diffusion facilitator family transporter [Algihabitans albus]|uniref:cation diffusion facilitator family transporter n=1 Tax=Algihabitans albus TaxID=2164067 RepID=UPI000E5D8AF3|nr:cation diffusion facilitator family transporter [Algihabitans albus]